MQWRCCVPIISVTESSHCEDHDGMCAIYRINNCLLFEFDRPTSRDWRRQSPSLEGKLHGLFAGGVQRTVELRSPCLHASFCMTKVLRVKHWELVMVPMMLQ